MLILSRVCADFHDRNGAVIHRVTPATRLIFHEAPDAIREDPLFAMLANDGSIVFPPKDEKERKRLENEPLLGVDPTGRRIKVDAGAEKSAGKAKTEKKPAAETRPEEAKPAGTEKT